MIPTLCGVIDRRILVNFRIDPEVVSSTLPEPFEPQTVEGHAIGGLCLIKLCDLRPRGVPYQIGLKSENQAHQFAVKWEENGDEQTGVYIPHRHTNSRVNSLFGGRLFPGVHHHAEFDVNESQGQYELTMQSRETNVQVAGKPTDSLPADSVFDSVEAASMFIENDTIGHSLNERTGEFDVLELHTDEWEVTPFSVTDVSSSYLASFPDDAVTFDHALLMKDIDHEWHEGNAVCAAATAD